MSDKSTLTPPRKAATIDKSLNILASCLQSVSCAIHGSNNQTATVKYMGRSVFMDIWEEATGNWYENGFSSLYLYGPAGVGKSHILTALVFSLIKQGNRVVYIPDCRAAVKDPWANIRIALLFAFDGYPDLQHAIAKAGTLNDIMKVICTLENHSLYLVVDQLNALDADVRETGHADRRKMDLDDAVASISNSQKYIFSSSANAISIQLADQKQTGIRVFRLNKGMTPVCPHTF